MTCDHKAAVYLTSPLSALSACSIICFISDRHTDCYDTSVHQMRMTSGLRPTGCGHDHMWEDSKDITHNYYW